MNDIHQKIQNFAMLLSAQTAERMKAGGSSDNSIKTYSDVVVKYGKKFVKVDIGGSGRYMVEVETGNIFGVKAYGVVHRGHFYGTVDTTAEYFWGEYYPKKIDGTLGRQKANGCPAMTYAPEQVKEVLEQAQCA